MMTEFNHNPYLTPQTIDVTPPKSLGEGSVSLCLDITSYRCELNKKGILHITLPEGIDHARVETELHGYLRELGLTNDLAPFSLSGVFRNGSFKVTSPFSEPVVYLAPNETDEPVPVIVLAKLLDIIVKGEGLESILQIKHVDWGGTKASLLSKVEDEHLQNSGWGLIVAAIFDNRYKENEDEITVYDNKNEILASFQLDRTVGSQIEKTVEGFEALPVYSQTSLTIIFGITCIGLPVAMSFVAKSAFQQIFAVKLFERAMRRGEKLKNAMDEADNIAIRQETILSRLLAKFGLSGNDNSVRTAAVSPTHTLDEEYHRAQLARLTLGTQYGIPHTMQETPKPTLIWVKREKPEKQKRTFRARRRGGRYFIKGQLTGLYESYLKVKNNPDAYPPDSRLRKIHDYVEKNFDVD